jgi:hypothetical protein
MQTVNVLIDKGNALYLRAFPLDVERPGTVELD